MAMMMPDAAPPVVCEAKAFTRTLFADEAKKAKVNLPPGATLRTCSSPRERSAVLTKPDSGGTEMCVVYEFGVDPKDPERETMPQRTLVAKSIDKKDCPALDYSAQAYPGKAWFFLSDNVPLPNAFKVKAAVESGGLNFVNEEAKGIKGSPPSPAYGTTPLGVYAIDNAKPSECKSEGKFFQERFAACYRVGIYNLAARGGWTMHVGLRKNGEYVFIRSTHAAK